MRCAPPVPALFLSAGSRTAGSRRGREEQPRLLCAAHQHADGAGAGKQQCPSDASAQRGGVRREGRGRIEEGRAEERLPADVERQAAGRRGKQIIRSVQRTADRCRRENSPEGKISRENQLGASGDPRERQRAAATRAGKGRGERGENGQLQKEKCDLKRLHRPLQQEDQRDKRIERAARRTAEPALLIRQEIAEQAET